MRILGALVVTASTLAAVATLAQTTAKISDDVVKIGLILDMSSLYADITGMGSVAAAQLAIDDFGGNIAGKPIQLVHADHQNKPDLAANIAREWFDRQQVDAILDVAASATALAAVEVGKEKNKIVVLNGPGAARLTNEACTPISVHYTYDTYSLAVTTGQATVKRGGDSWFFITADYAFGHELERDTAAVVKSNGGQVLGSVRAPLNNADFFIVPFAGSSVEGEGGRARECGDRYDERYQAGSRVRSHEERPEPRRAPGLRKRRQGSGPAGRRRHAPHGSVLLGPQ
jgi:branched-chain amino acid transport system substrate-binding protein